MAFYLHFAPFTALYLSLPIVAALTRRVSSHTATLDLTIPKPLATFKALIAVFNQVYQLNVQRRYYSKKDKGHLILLGKLLAISSLHIFKQTSKAVAIGIMFKRFQTGLRNS